MEDSQKKYYLKKLGMEVGSSRKFLTKRHMDWLATNKPGEMTVGEYLVTALLDDAMAEDAE